MQKICLQCQVSFEITDDDLAFYEKVSPVFNGKKYTIPPPITCPNCRYQQRVTWRNENNFYRRTCSATGKSIVSIWSAEKPWPPVYEQEFWWSDKWDAKSFGKGIDFSKPFFEQFLELYRVTPQVTLYNRGSENAEFTNQSEYNKDCYMLVCSSNNRDTYYGRWFQNCVNCMDCGYAERSECCYEVLNVKDCYNCTRSQNLTKCTDTHFSRYCIGCTNCVGCINLRNKQYCLFNEQLEKEEYEKRVQELKLETFSGQREVQKKANEKTLTAPYKYFNGSNAETFSGDYLQNVKNTIDCFNCRDTENTIRCQDAWQARNCRDMTDTLGTDYCYSIEGIAEDNNVSFCMKSSNAKNLLYCSHCNNAHDCFGCVSLTNGAYCILNKQYTQEEYEKLAAKLAEHMKATGEWGQYFPIELSPFGYNETVAQEYFPLTKEEVLKKGWRWKEVDDAMPSAKKVIPANTLPDSIDDVPDDILNWAIKCEATKRPFRIIKQELEFYRQMKLPIPHIHPDERHKRRMALRNPRKLWDRQCAKCNKEISTTYAPERPEIVYCEECYLKEVY